MKKDMADRVSFRFVLKLYWECREKLENIGKERVIVEKQCIQVKVYGRDGQSADSSVQSTVVVAHQSPARLVPVGCLSPARSNASDAL